MESEHHLLFGILAYQNGFVSRQHLLAAVDQWLQDKTQNLEQILLNNSAIEEKKVHLLNELMNQRLLNQSAQESLHRTIGSDTDSLLTELRSRNDQDIYDTIGPTASHATGSGSRSIETTPADSQRFRILRPHDEGGLGKVSVALDTQLDREVALKEIKPQYADDQASRSRFMLEAEITGGLEHPGIVPIYGLGAANDGRPYYAMRFIKGDNLSAAIKQFHENPDEANNAVALRRLLGRFLDVCNAVYYAHQRGVLHRDLKPGNVMLGEYGETLVVDWGLAKSVSMAEQSASDESIAYRETPLKPRSGSVVDATQLGSAIGSPHFMSPEQARGEHDSLGPATDVYSLGATLYTLLTNCKPVDGASIEEILENVQFGNRQTARQQKPSVDAALSAICERAMAQEAAERYPSVRQLANDVERYLADEPANAYREPILRRAQRWIRKHPRIVGSLAATLVAGIVSIATIAGVISKTNRQLGEKNTELADLNLNLERARDEAESARNEALVSRDKAIVAREQAEEVADFMTLIFKSSDPQYYGRHLTVMEAMDVALVNLDNEFSSDPLTKAKLLGVLGQTYLGLGLPHKATPLSKESYELYQTHLGESHDDTLLALNNFSAASLQAGNALEALELLERALKLSTEVRGANHLKTLTVLGNLATAYDDAGQLRKSRDALRDVLSRRQQHLGATHEDTLKAMSNLAASQLKSGDTEESIALQGQALELMHDSLGPKHPDSIHSSHQLANAYLEAADTDAAFKLLKDTLDMAVEVLGPTHPKTFDITNSYAVALTQAGETQEGIAILEKAVASSEEILGKFHPRTNLYRGNIATLYFYAGKEEQAVRIAEELFKANQDKFGTRHPDTISLMHNLAHMYAHVGANEESLRLAEAVLEARLSTLGAEHPDTLSSMASLGTIYLRQGRTGEAINLIEQTLETMQNTLGTQDKAILSTKSDLADAYLQAGQVLKSLELNQEVFSFVKDILGETHPETMTAILNLANAYQQSGQIEKAIPLLENALALRREHWGDDHTHTLGSLASLAEAYLLAGRAQEAVGMLEGLAEKFGGTLGSDHPKTIQCKSRLAEAYVEVGLTEKAVLLRQAVLEARQGEFGKDHTKTLYAMHDLAQLYGNIGNHKESIGLYEQALEGFRKKHGKAHTDTLTSMNNLATQYLSADRTDEAIAIYQESLEVLRTHLGEEDHRTVAAVHNLASAYRIAGKMQEAMALYEKAYAYRSRALGDAHESTIQTMYGLGLSYNSMRHREKQLELYKKLVTLTQNSSIASVRESYLSMLTNLGRSHLLTGDIDSALPIFERAYQSHVEKTGEDDARTLASWHDYHNTLIFAGEYEKAIELGKQHLRTISEGNGIARMADHLVIGEALLASGDFEAAIAEAEQSIGIFRAILPVDQIQIDHWWYCGLVGSSYVQQQEWQKAVDYLNRAIKSIPQDRIAYELHEWRVIERIYTDLALSCRESELLAEAEKWEAELEKFQEDRAKLDPLYPKED